MPWIQAKIHVEPDATEIFEDLLLAIGAQSVTMMDGGDEPIFEPVHGTTPLWQDTHLVALFDSDDHPEARLKQLADSYKKNTQQDFPRYQLEQVEDKDWEREWMKHFKPIQFGERLWVCPSWHEIPDPKAVNLMLDPGLAFGTGTHPTTALCLEWLDAQSLENCDIVDFGCGSGILGIAGLLLGARYMHGVDTDPQALKATKDNASRNHINDARFDVYLPEAAPSFSAPFVVANILAGPLVELASVLADHCHQGGKIALSGILEHQAEEVRRAYEPYFDLDKTVIKGDWVRVSGTKK